MSRRRHAKRLERYYFVYIMTNKWDTVLYTGVTNDLKRRAQEHRERLVDGFAKRYNLTKLVYLEVFGSPGDAIAREKQIKAGSRRQKVDLIMGFNPHWVDLYDRLSRIGD